MCRSCRGRYGFEDDDDGESEEEDGERVPPHEIVGRKQVYGCRCGCSALLCGSVGVVFYQNYQDPTIQFLTIITHGQITIKVHDRPQIK